MSLAEAPVVYRVTVRKDTVVTGVRIIHILSSPNPNQTDLPLRG